MPNIGDDQLLIKIDYTYVCGSQLNEIDGKKVRTNIYSCTWT